MNHRTKGKVFLGTAGAILGLAFFQIPGAIFGAIFGADDEPVAPYVFLEKRIEKTMREF